MISTYLRVRQMFFSLFTRHQGSVKFSVGRQWAFVRSLDLSGMSWVTVSSNENHPGGPLGPCSPHASQCRSHLQESTLNRSPAPLLVRIVNQAQINLIAHLEEERKLVAL